MIIIKTCKNCVENKDFCKNCISYSNQVEHTPEEHKACLQRMKTANQLETVEKIFDLMEGKYNGIIGIDIDSKLSSTDIWNGLTYPKPAQPDDTMTRFQAFCEEKTVVKADDMVKELTIEEVNSLKQRERKLKDSISYMKTIQSPTEEELVDIKELKEELEEVLIEARLLPNMINITYSYKLAVKRSASLSNYIIDDDKQEPVTYIYSTATKRGTLYSKIEPRFQANKRKYATACSKNKSRRFKCPVCEVSANEYGYCPVCNKRILVDSRGQFDKGSFHRLTREQKGKFSEVYGPRGKDGKPTIMKGQKYDYNWNPEKVAAFYGQFTTGKMNFIGIVNKKSCGRGPTGWLSKDPEEVRKHSHNVIITMKPNIRMEPTSLRVKVDGYELDIVKVRAGNPCYNSYGTQGFAGISHIPVVCTASHKVHDERRDEVVCPQCGLVFGRGVPEGV